MIGRRKDKIRAGMAAAAALAMLAAPATAQKRGMVALAGDPVETGSGKVAGTRLDSGVHAWLGIPFAQPPVGANRWAAPKPIRWQGVWNADRKGPECIQVLRPHDINHYFGEEATSEDCLTLNLWAPADAARGAKRPVIVFIYGGGFTIGSSGMANYDGEAVAKAGAIAVNFNYRVGAFGFLAHPELSKEQGGHSGNYGIMDQIAALRWIRENIAQFGGDPDRVLVMGQSAGAFSVASLIFAPEAKGLFNSAVMLSGCNYRTPWPTLESAEQTGLRLQQRLGAASLAKMRDLPADRILAVQSENQVGVTVEGIRIGGPILDGKVLPLQKDAALKAGAVNRVPAIAAYTSDDIDIAMSPLGRITGLADYRAQAEQLFGADAAQFLKLFPASTDEQARAAAREAARAQGFVLAARQCAVDQAKLGQATYIARFSRHHPFRPGVAIADVDPATIGAYHTSDVPYWLGTLDAYNSLRPTRDWTAEDRALSASMLGALIAMAKTGSPDTPALRWPAWSARAERQLDIGAAVAVTPLDVKRMEWMEAHPLDRIAPAGARSHPID